MIRPVTCICALLAGGAGLFLYQSKHRTLMLDRQIEQTFHQIDDARQKTGILEAEWALLNSPDRLAELADKYLTLKPVAPTQFVTLADLDQRLPPPRPVVAQAAADESADATPPAGNEASSAEAPASRDSRSGGDAPAQAAGTAELRHDAAGTGALRRDAEEAAALRRPRHERAIAEGGYAEGGHNAAAAPVRHAEDIRRHEMPERHRAMVLVQRDTPKRATKSPAAVAAAEVALRPGPARAEREARVVRSAPVYAPPARPAAFYTRTPPVTGSLLGGVHAVMAPPVPVADVQ